MSYEDVKNELVADVEQEDQGSRYYAREFKKLYGLRKVLRKIEVERNQRLTNKEAYDLAVEMINEVVE